VFLTLFAWLALAPTAHADPIVKLLTFQDSPDPVSSTQNLTYHLQVSTVLADAAGVVLTVPVPAGTTFISASDGSCTYTAPNVVCGLGSMLADTDRLVDIVLNVTAPGGSSLTSTAFASSTTPGETNSSVMQTTSVTAGADLQLTSLGSPNPVAAGGLVTFTLTATNAGPDASSALSIADVLPPNVTYVSSSGSGWGCSAAGSNVTCTRSGTFANGASSIVSIVGQLQSSINGNITNSATLSAAVPDGNPSNNTTTASVAVTAGADLRITKSALPSPMIGNAAATFTLAPRNAGPDAASSVSVSDTLPVGFTGIAASGTNWICNVVQATRAVTCTRASMPSGATNDITITATAPDNSVVPSGGMSTSNTGSISASTTDPDPTNNSGTVNFTIQRDGVDMSVSKSKSPNPVASGAPLTSQIVARNNGPRALGGGDTITLTDTLPAGEDYSGAASFTNNGWNCTFAAPVFTCTRSGPLAIGANAPTLTLVTSATAAASLTNQACVAIAGTYTDPNSANNCVSASSSSTVAHADLTIVKSQNLATVTATDNTETYTLTITNNGPQDSANVVVADVIPMRTLLAGGTVISALAGTGSKGSTGSCSVVAATVTCNYAALLYASGAPSNTAETAAITITVQRPMADGTFTNTATINSTSVGDPDRSNNTSSVITTVDPVADVEVQSKTVAPNPVLAGTDATYVISFRNVGPSTAQNVTIEDQFNPTPGDAGYTVKSAIASQGSCSFNAGTNLLTCPIGTLTAGEVESVTVIVRPTWMSSPPGGRNLQNTATASTTTPQSTTSNDSKNATLNINGAQVDLIANITDVASFVGVNPDPMGYDGITTTNNIITYRVTVTNAGPSVATGVTFQNVYTPPATRSVTFLCDSTDQYSCTGVAACAASGAATVTGPTTQIVNCSASDLEAGSTYTRYLRYQVNSPPAVAGDSYNNAVTATSNEPDANTSSNSASEPTAVRAKADLAVTSKTALIASPPLQYGQPFQWQIKVKNNGPGDAYQSVLTDSMPTNMELVLPISYTVSPGSGTCLNTGVSQFTCNLGTIVSGDEQTVTVDVFIRKPASAPPLLYTNTASVTTFSVDPVAANDSNSGSVSLVKSSIAGRVYRDNDNDGVIDGGEVGIASVTLTLTGHDIFNNVVSRTATSDASGNYILDNLEQADATGYTITETQPAGYSDGLETAGTAATGTPPGGAVSATVGTNTITGIVLDKDQVATGYHFGELRNNSLGGTVFADVNNNGIKAASEPGIANVTITLTGTDVRGAAVNRTTTTNSTGAYSFANVLPGTYQLAETQPSTYVDGIDTAGSLGGSAAVNDIVSAIPVTDTNGTGYNFAEQSATLSGRVWRDADRDGVLDGTEVGLNNITLTLSGTDTLGAAVNRTTTTNATGDYSLPDLPGGTFTVTETQPTGYGSTTANSLSGIAIVAAGTTTGHDFGDSTSDLAGFVFFDRNANGVNDGTDSAIASVTLTLTGTDGQGGAVNRTTTTDAAGVFAFADLIAPNASGYTLTETQPTAYSNGQITAGGAGGTVNQGLNRVSAIALPAGTPVTGYRFAELGTVISGVVYRDADRDGANDVGELGLSGVTIALRDGANAVVATTTTAANGSYTFPPQPGGSYTVVETQPTGYQSGPQNASNSVALTLVAGTPSTVDFGESAGSLTGRVFLDGNSNGIQDGGEIGLPGVTITLTGTASDGSIVNVSSNTNASGQYTFSDLLSGTYVITETQPASFGDGLDVLGAGNTGGTPGNDIYTAIALPAGTQATGYNFSETGAAVVGVVFRDMNRDGTQQSGDTGIAGVTLTLKDAGNATVGTTTTAADGSFLFAGISAGNYTVVETQPAGYGSSSGSPDTVSIIVPAGGGASVLFADTLSTLKGSVYIDLNSNGARDSGEPGISGISVTLAGTDATSAAVNRLATTDASGVFEFIDLLTPNATGYTLSEPVQPASYADGIDAAGSAGGTAGNDTITAIHLGTNVDATGYTFGERGTTISGVVYKDVNGDGTRAAGDPPLAGITITLKDGLGAVVGTTTTAADGTYSFSGLPAGNYQVEETQPPGYGSSTPDVRSITVPAGGSATADFGETTSSFAGFVWSDTNNNGARDAGEPGISSVAITLTGNDANGVAVNRSVLTDTNGNFIVADVLGGTYALTETQPAAYADGLDVLGTVGGTLGNDTVTAITLPVGTAATGYLFGELGQSITGRVWLDSNRNATLETGEAGIAGVLITLKDASNAVVATTTSAVDGTFSFANIPAGHYTVEETQPAGFGSSTPNTLALDLTAGGTPTVVNFGETAGSIAGLTFNDTNNNGTRDAGEPPIPGVTLNLTGTDARGLAVSMTVVTDDTGTYRFNDVAGGTYAIAELQPAGYTDGLDSVGSAGGTLGNDTISAIALGAAVDATDYLFSERGASASIAGTVWRDANHDRVRDSNESELATWIVELYQSTLLIQGTTTDVSGHYQFDEVPPGSGYEVRFREPASGAVYGNPVTNETGATIAAGTVGPGNPGGADPRSGTLRGLTLTPGGRLDEQSLPIDPTGVVYDSVSRQPIVGATVVFSGPAGFDPATQLVGGASNAQQITGISGFYQFLLLPTAPAGVYSISVTPPPGRYTPGASSLIPACAGPLSVGAVPDPAVVQASDTAPGASVPNLDAASCPTNSAQLASGEGTTQYFYSFAFTPGTSVNLLNNHVPIDPILGGALAVTKSTPMVNVSRGDLVPYTITVTNTLNALLTNVDVRDLLPPGFAYRMGSASVNGVTNEPQRAGRQLTWTDQVFAPHERKVYKLVLVVGAGVGEGEYVNQAFGLNNLIGATISNVATAAVRVVPDPVFDCPDVIGKVFDDRNANGYQDDGEPGIPNARLATLNGVLVTSDAEGRFHVACAAIPNEYRGSSFVMKLDVRTLPAGYRVTTENPRDIRLTRGKVTKLNFGATIHRVLRLEVSDAAFEAGSTELKAEWRARVADLPRTLQDKPSIVRIAYSAGTSDRDLADRRVKTLIQQIARVWRALPGSYPLQIEDDSKVAP
jgi:uncharacterized repeat protein (TIGR01451 family)